MLPNVIGFKDPEVLFHMAALGHTEALGTELDYRATDGGLGHGICIHVYKFLDIIVNHVVHKTNY